ncbi:MAG: HTH domain-containing protein [Bacteroidales bacterium]|nr:HTH domain-containing protein [Bacteroidales bacterium]
MDGLAERQQIIHTAIKQNVVDGVVVTASTLSKQLKVHPRTIQRDLAVLASKHLIRHVGSDRTGHWEPIEK